MTLSECPPFYPPVGRCGHLNPLCDTTLRKCPNPRSSKSFGVPGVQNNLNILLIGQQDILLPIPKRFLGKMKARLLNYKRGSVQDDHCVIINLALRGAYSSLETEKILTSNIRHYSMRIKQFLPGASHCFHSRRFAAV